MIGILVILSIMVLAAFVVVFYYTCKYWKENDMEGRIPWLMMDCIGVLIIGIVVFLWTRPHFGDYPSQEDVDNGKAHVVMDTTITEHRVWNDVEQLND